MVRTRAEAGAPVGRWARRAQPVGALIGLLASALVLGCSEPEPTPEPPPQEAPAPQRGWESSLLFEAGFEVTALAAGELDRAPGAELVVLGAQGQVLIARREGARWERELVQTGGGPLRAALAGDFDPSSEGLELAVCGETEDQRGRVLLLTKTSQGIWRPRLVFASASPLYALLETEGLLFVSGGGLTRLVRRGRDWEGIAIGELESPGRALLAWREQVWVGCTSGRIVSGETVARGGEEREPWCRVEAGVFALAAAGESLVCADAGGALARREGKSQDAGWREIYRSLRPLRCALIADLDPEHPGAEVFTCGDAGELVVVSGQADGVLRPRVLRAANAPWLGLVQLDEASLVVAGQGGSVVELRWRP